MQITVLGAGAWGTALATALSKRHDVTLWARAASDREQLRARRESPRLPGIALPASIRIVDGLDAEPGGLVIAATATAGLADTVARFREPIRAKGLLWACKGFEPDSGRLPHEIVASALPGFSRSAALSGPSFAQEVAQGLPAALTVSSNDGEFAREAATALNGSPLRIYSSGDLVGTELGGAVKNVIAIATGISDGLGLGNNARAALVTRGLAEIARLGVALGGKPATFMGLTGLGDLVLTATGALSRNRTVGLRIAEGRPLAAVLRELGHVAEGVPSARWVQRLSRRHGLEMPITDMVCSVLFDGMPPKTAAEQLLARDAKAE